MTGVLYEPGRFRQRHCISRLQIETEPGPGFRIRHHRGGAEPTLRERRGLTRGKQRRGVARGDEKILSGRLKLAGSFKQEGQFRGFRFPAAAQAVLELTGHG